MDFLSYLEHFSKFEWILYSLATNFGLYLFSISLYIFVDKTCRKERLQQEDFPVTKSDVFLSFLTVILNAVVMLIGVFLWKEHWIVIDDTKSVFSVIVEIMSITIIMDFLMFMFHYIAHLPFFYKILHHKHHEHVSTNYLSLFVLHPLETLGFGVMMMLVFMAYPFSMISIGAYLFINLVWGTIGHLNREFFPKWMEKIFLGTSKFHNQHHQDERHNFGFYTSVWDRIFKTYKS